MLKIGTENKYEQPNSGPHTIVGVHTNGTVRLRIGAVTDTVNIRRIESYKQSPHSIHGEYAIGDAPRGREDEQ